MKTGFAKIPVQQSFCARCSIRIRKELLEISNISNVQLYPADSMVIFNFIKANEVADALNVLTSLGYPPKGDKIAEMPERILCEC